MKDVDLPEISCEEIQEAVKIFSVLPLLDDKEALRRWKMSRKGKHCFFSKYWVSKDFIETQIKDYPDFFHKMSWNDISFNQRLSCDFIARNITNIDFFSLRRNPFVNQNELEEKGIYLMAKLIGLY